MTKVVGTCGEQSCSQSQVYHHGRGQKASRNVVANCRGERRHGQRSPPKVGQRPLTKVVSKGCCQKATGKGRSERLLINPLTKVVEEGTGQRLWTTKPWKKGR